MTRSEAAQILLEDKIREHDAAEAALIEADWNYTEYESDRPGFLARLIWPNATRHWDEKLASLAEILAAAENEFDECSWRLGQQTDWLKGPEGQASIDKMIADQRTLKENSSAARIVIKPGEQRNLNIMGVPPKPEPPSLQELPPQAFRS
jgi:hypothetical protein